MCLLPLVLSCNSGGCIPLGSFLVLLTRDPGCLFSSDIPFASLEHKKDAMSWLCQSIYSLLCILTFSTVAMTLCTASSTMGMNASYLQNTKQSHKYVFFKQEPQLHCRSTLL